MKLPGKTVIWPANLDSSKSRKEGRKLSKGFSVQAPRLDELDGAAKRLSLDSEVVVGKSRPGVWWEKGGYLVVPKSATKTELLHTLSTEIKKMRAAKAAQEKEHR